MVGVSCRACWDGQPGPPAWGDRESCPGGGRSVLQGLWGRRTGHTGLGGWGFQPRGWSEFPAGPAVMDNRAHRPGGMGSPAQGVVGASCRACGDVEPGTPAWGDGESCPGGGRSLLPGQWGAIFLREPGAPAWGGQGSSPRGVRSLVPGLRGATFFRELGAPAWGGRGVQPRGCSEPPARPTGGHLPQRTGRTGPGGTGSPAHGVFGVSCQASGGPSSSENRAHRPGGDGESCPGGVRSVLPEQWGAIFFREPGAPAWGGQGVLPRGCSESPARPVRGHLLQRTGRTGPGGTGSPAQGVFGVSCQGQWGAIFFREPGAPALGGTGSPAQGVFGVSCKASGGPSSSENRAHRPGGDGESCPGGVRSLLPGQWGAIFFREPGAPAPGGRRVLPRGCSESPARANGGPSSSENRAHRPGGDGESCPGGVRSLLQGQWGAIFFRGPGAPARGGRGVLPRGCSESPGRPMGGHLLRRTGRTGLGGTGSPAQGVFGASGRTRGYSLLPLSTSRQVCRQYRGS